MPNKDETNPRRKQQIIHINLTVQCRDEQPIHSKRKLTFCLKVIPWFCTAHLLLRITRWPPLKRACEVTLLK